MTPGQLKWLEENKDLVENQELDRVFDSMICQVPKLPFNEKRELCVLLTWAIAGLGGFSLTLISKGPSRSNIRKEVGQNIYTMWLNTLVPWPEIKKKSFTGKKTLQLYGIKGTCDYKYTINNFGLSLATNVLKEVHNREIRSALKQAIIKAVKRLPNTDKPFNITIKLNEV